MATKKRPSKVGSSLRGSTVKKAAGAQEPRRSRERDINSEVVTFVSDDLVLEEAGNDRFSSGFSRFGTVMPELSPMVTTKLMARVMEELQIPHRTELIAKALGSRAELARVLRVSNSQPTRWIKGQESPNPENTRAIVDMDHVIARARLLWSDDDVVSSWLNGSNAFLDGARPIDVIATDGSAPVIAALDQAMSGAYA